MATGYIRFVCVLLVICGFAASASANIPYGDNVLGIYTAPDFGGQAYITYTGEFRMSAYLCLTGATNTDPIGAFDCKIQLPANVAWMNPVFPAPGAINFGGYTPGEFLVGYPLPGLLNDEVIVLAELNWIWMGGTSAGRFYLHPLPTSSFALVPGQMSLQHCPPTGNCDSPTFVPMNWASGSESTAIFGINTGAPYYTAPRFSVVATVRSEEGNVPLAGATVALLASGDVIGQKTTDATGACRFATKDPAAGETYTVLAIYEGKTGSEVIGPVTGTPTRYPVVRVPTTTRVQGWLRDDHNYAAIANMAIEVSDESGVVWAGNTSEYGWFTFPYATVGTHTFEVTIRGTVGNGYETDLYKPGTSVPVTVSVGDLTVNLGTLYLKTNVVVLLHGIIGSNLDWWYISWPEHLRNDRWAVYDGIDLPGEVNLPGDFFELHGAARIEEQAQYVKDLIDNLGVKSVHVVAHSQGGLVARYMNENLAGPNGNVDKMICLATPHHGSPLAIDVDFLLDWLGPAIVAAHPTLRTVTVALWLEHLRHQVPAAAQLKPNSEFLKSLNQRGTGDDWNGTCGDNAPRAEQGLKARTSYLTLRGISYGDAAEWAISAANLWKYWCGNSDGIVPTISAMLHAGTGNVYNYRHTAHHKDDSVRIFKDPTVRELVRARLLEDPASWPAENKEVSPQESAAFENWSSIGFRELLVPAGGAAADSLRVDPCDTVRFACRWFAGHADFSLISPTGTVIDSAYAAGDPGVTWLFDGVSAGGICIVANPEPGQWRLDAAVKDVSDDQNVIVTAMASGAVSMNTRVDRMESGPYADRVVSVDLIEAAGAPVAGATVTADWTGPSGATGQIGLVDSGLAPDAIAGDGVYTGLLPIEGQLGATALNIQAVGSGAVTFARNALITVDEDATLDVAIVGGELTATSVSLLAYSPVDLGAFVSNGGAFDAEVEVRFVLANTGTVLSANTIVIPAGSTAECTGTHLPLEPDLYEYAVEVVPVGSFYDTNPANNSAAVSVRIAGVVSAVADDGDGSDPGLDLPPELAGRGAMIVTAYPNPFNPAVTIKLAHEKAGPVSVRVFDLRGRLVRQLLVGQQAAGSFELMWRGDDDTGRSVSAGVYFVHFRSGDGEDIHKVTLMK